MSLQVPLLSNTVTPPGKKDLSFHEFSDLSISEALSINFPYTCRLWVGAFAYSTAYMLTGLLPFAIMAESYERLYKEMDEWIGNSLFLFYFIIIYPLLFVGLNRRLYRKYGPEGCLKAHLRISSFLCGPESRPVGQTLVALARVYEGQQGKVD